MSSAKWRPFCPGIDMLLKAIMLQRYPITGWHFVWVVNILRPKRNGQRFADDIFKRIFFNENVWISIKISLTFVPKSPIYNIPVLFQIMAWRRPGDKPLSEALMDNLPTHICVTRPQWVNRKGQTMTLKIALVVLNVFDYVQLIAAHFDEKKNHIFRGCGEKTVITRLILRLAP